MAGQSLRPQMELNGILEWEGQHDVIYGDCFDWLVRLAEKNEQFDVVILDPPSTSVVRKKKKRWSVKSDMAGLATLAAPLVKSYWLLFTNSASWWTETFVNMCKNGLIDAGINNAKLERVFSMMAFIRSDSFNRHEYTFLIVVTLTFNRYLMTASITNTIGLAPN